LSYLLPRIIFITGTDTGVGKTVLTALLLAHLRQGGQSVLAMKPFCSGGREDARILHELQDGALSLNQVNPFHFSEPLAPLVAVRKHRRRISIDQVLQRINQVLKKLSVQCPITPPLHHSIIPPPSPLLLIEGAGGLLAPLGEGYTNLDLIRQLRCEVIIVARNELGTINHTLLTIHALQNPPIHPLSGRVKYPAPHVSRFTLHASLLPRIILMNPARPDPSSHSNPRVLTEKLSPMAVILLPFLAKNPLKKATFERISKKLKKTLARILILYIFYLTFFVK
jgi:dethiobiotin synthetase